MNKQNNDLNNNFQLKSNFKPSGDQPQAIDELIKGLNNNEKDQVLLGVTGSGKTFTMGNVITDFQKPTLILSVTHLRLRKRHVLCKLHPFL